MIEVRGLNKTLDDGFRLENISFNLEDGESLVIVGPSGCGKTTLLRLIAGLDIPDSGEILFNKLLVSGPGWASEPHTRDIGFIFQTPALWPHMSVAQNIIFGLNHVDRTAQKNRLDHLAEQLGITGLLKRRPGNISKGEARRVSIARSLAPKPSLLLMDEALSNLDIDTKTTVMNFLLSELKENGTSLIYVTHDLDESEIIGKRKLQMRAGRII